MQLKTVMALCLVFVSACSSMPAQQYVWADTPDQVIRTDVFSKNYEPDGKKFYEIYHIVDQVVTDNKDLILEDLGNMKGMERLGQNSFLRNAFFNYFISAVMDVVIEPFSKDIDDHSIAIARELLQREDTKRLIKCEIMGGEPHCERKKLEKKLESKYKHRKEEMNKFAKSMRYAAKNLDKEIKAVLPLIFEDAKNHLVSVQQMSSEIVVKNRTAQAKRLITSLLEATRLDSYQNLMAITHERIVGKKSIVGGSLNEAASKWLLDYQVNRLASYLVDYSLPEDIDLLERTYQQPESQLFLQNKFIQALKRQELVFDLPDGQYDIQGKVVDSSDIYAAVDVLAQAAHRYSLWECSKAHVCSR